MKASDITNNDWTGTTSSSNSVTYVGSATGYCNSCSGWNCCCKPSYPYVIYPGPTLYGKVKLSLDEVNRLRELAKEDKLVRKILKKFEDKIEVDVEL